MEVKSVVSHNHTDESETSFAATLRAARKNSGQTLDTLAKNSAVSKSTLSRIENDHLSPTYDVICKIARGLGLSVESLFRKPEKESFRGWRSVTRKTDRSCHNTSHYNLELLCSDVADRGLLMFVANITARSMDEFADLVRHEGEEQIFVLSGMVEVHTEFYDPVRLTEGDSMAFDSRMGHAILSVSEADAQILWVTDGHKPNTD